MMEEKFILDVLEENKLLLHQMEKEIQDIIPSYNGFIHQLYIMDSNGNVVWIGNKTMLQYYAGSLRNDKQIEVVIPAEKFY